LLLPLHYNSWGCGGFLGSWSTGNHIPEDTEYIGRTGRTFWGFDDAYPMMLRDVSCVCGRFANRYGPEHYHFLLFFSQLNYFASMFAIWKKIFYFHLASFVSHGA